MTTPSHALLPRHPALARGVQTRQPAQPFFWSLYLGGAALAAGLASLALPGHLVLTLAAASSTLAIIAGIRLHRPARVLPWYLFAAGQAVFVAGAVFRSAIPAPSLYPLLIAGVVLLIRYRNPAGDRASLIDALIVSTGLGLAGWVFLIAPYAGDASLTLMSKLVSIAYPVMDVLLLTVACRLAVDGGRHRPAFSLMLLSIVCLLGADTIHGLALVHRSTAVTGLVDVGWVAFSLVWGAAALHPSMRDLTRPVPDQTGRLTARRLGFLTGATLMAPAVEVYERSRHSGSLVAVGASVLLILLVLARMAGLFRREEESLQRERVLREAGATLVAAKSRDEIFSAALEAVRAIVGRSRSADLFVVTDAGELHPVGATAGRGPRSSLLLTELSPATQEALVEWRSGEALSLPDLASRLYGECEPGPDPGASPMPVWGWPLINRDDLRAFALVTGPRVSPAAERSVTTLASQLALALESLELAEQIHHQRSESRFHNLIQNATDVVWIVAPDSTILYLSPSVTRVLGHLPEELAGTKLWLLLHPGDRQFVLQLLETADWLAAPSVAEFRVRHADGSWCHFETHLANLVHDPDVGGIVLNSRDVSERRRAEADRGLLEGRLEQAQRLEAIGQLAGGVAHDFNNVLGAILTYASLLAKGVTSRAGADPTEAQRLEKMARDVDKIREAAQRGTSLIHELLIVGRRDPIHPEVIDLNSTIGELVELVRDTVGDGIELSVGLDPSVLPVTADRSCIERVLTNLVINARDAMADLPAGGGTLSIETGNVEIADPVAWAPELPPGRYVRLSVSDTGCGMSREVRSRAFDPFFTTKAPGQGSGLGLATLYGIVKHAGGDVYLHSEQDQGTVVSVYLPADQAAARPVLRLMKTPGPAPGRHQILVVEGDEGVRAETCRLLADWGCDVLAAASGQEALRVAAQCRDPIALLLTDLALPAMSGRELAQRLLPGRPDLKVVYTSGHPRDVTRNSLSGSGTPLLGKPFTEAALLRAVSEALEPAHPHGQGPA